MTDRKKFPVLMLVCGALLANSALIGCEEEGPAEKLGEKIDNSIEKAGDKIEDATDN